MNLTEKPGNFFNSKIEAAIILVCSGLLIPFFILAYFDYPTLDDFSFALKNIDHGYWGGQIAAYKEWNGRYFASAILIAHPLVLHSFALYKIFPVFLLALTFYSIYYFLRTCFSTTRKSIHLILSAIISLHFLDQMPTLVQGIYWAPGAITYQLANCMTLLLCALLCTAVTEPERFPLWKKIAGAFLLLATIGSNETSMLLVCLLLACFMLYYFITEGKFNKLILVYLLLAAIGTIIVFVSPGNAIRETGYVCEGKHDFWFTIRSSFSEGTRCISEWILTWQNCMFSILIICAGFIHKKTDINLKQALFLLSFVLIGGYLLLCATFATSFWSTASIPVDRTLNTIFWLFVLLWSCFLYSATICIRSNSAFSPDKIFRPAFILSFIPFLITFKASGNYYRACNDLASGKASVYRKEYLKRVEKMETSSNNIVIELPAYTMFPKSLYIIDDIQNDPVSWSTIEYEKYFNRSYVKSIPAEPALSCKYLVTYDSESDKKMGNPGQITNEHFFSAPNSTFIQGHDSYSAIFEKKIKDINIDNASQISNIALSAEIFSEDSLVNATIVITVLGPEGKQMNVFYWSGINLNNNHYPVNKWTKENLVFPIVSNATLNPENRLKVYLWNKSYSKAKVYMDDLLISIY